MAAQTKLQLILELKNRIKAGLSSARDSLSKNISSMKLKMSELKEHWSEVIKNMAADVPILGELFDKFSGKAAAIAAGILLVGGTYVKAAKMASEWKTSMNQVNVTAQLTQQELSGLSDELLDIGKRNTGDLMEVPKTFNTIVSAGFDVQTSLAALEPTLKAAKAGFTDAGTAAEAATNVMGSTGILDATKIYDVLFATLNVGKAEFADIANYLPKIIPGARNVGVTLEQTAGSFAFLTATGLKAEAASTALEGAMRALSRTDVVYGSKSKGGFKGLGIDIFDATGKVRDLVDISKDLNKVLAGKSDAQKASLLDSIGLDDSAKLAFSKMSQGIDQLDESIKFTTNSAGQLNMALEAAKHPLDSWLLLGNNIKASMIELGSTALPILGSIGDFLMNNLDVIKDVGTMILSVAAAWGVYALVTNASAIALGVATAAQWAFNAAMTANPIGLIVTAIGLLIGGLVIAYQRSQKFRAILAGVMEVASLLADIFIGLGKTIVGALTFNPKMFTEGAMQAASAVQEVMNGGITKRFNKGYDEKIAKEKTENAAKAKAKEQTKVAPQGGLKTTGVTPTGKPVTGSSDVGKVTGSAQQIKNLTINMDAMVKMGDFVSKHPEMANKSPRELEQWFMELCARMIRNLETSYS